MKILLDTNILIHRESNTVINKDIGVLFNWIDKLHYEKYISQLSIIEINKHKDSKITDTINAKIKNYNVIRTKTRESEQIKKISTSYDKSDNDKVDSALLNELVEGVVDAIITEDKNIHSKAKELKIHNQVFTINSFIEKVTLDNPGLSEYKVLSVRKSYFGDLNLDDRFFDSFKTDYKNFESWFKGKSQNKSYVCRSDKNEIVAFLYIKVEGKNENYSDISPPFSPGKRLKIGTFKVVSTGYKLGERFLKIIFDNALINNVDELYITIFDKTDNQKLLIDLIQEWGFVKHGNKTSTSELVYIKDFKPIAINNNPKLTYPFIDRNRRFFIVSIYPEYHTELLPDSILNNERPENFIEDKPYRNAIQKVYISRGYERSMSAGDIIVFYRTGGLYKGVITTLGIVDSITTNIKSIDEFSILCKKRSVFSDQQLHEQWDWKKTNRPFIVNFLYLYSFPVRINLKRLIELSVFTSTKDAPRGFKEITKQHFELLLKETKTNESFIIN